MIALLVATLGAIATVAIATGLIVAIAIIAPVLDPAAVVAVAVAAAIGTVAVVAAVFAAVAVIAIAVATVAVAAGTAVVASPAIAGTAVAGTAVVADIVPPVAAILTIIAASVALVAPLLGALAGAVVEPLVGVHLAVIIVIVLVLPVRAIEAITTLLLLVEARARLAQHAEIMIGELEIIFGHHTIALALGVAGERLVFLVELAGIAARAIIEPAPTIGRPATTIRTRRTPGPSTATTVAVLTIVDQLFAAFVTGGICSPLLSGPAPDRSHAKPRRRKTR